MFDPARLVLFLVAATVLVVVPGPAVIYIVTRSVSQGRAAGVVSVLGVGLGNFLHVVAAVLGLSALLAASTLAFSIVKYGGAAYLIFIGLRRLFSRSTTALPTLAAGEPPLRVFWQAVIVATLNPKTALFFLAFLPQFTDATRGSVQLQLFVLGTATVLLGVTSDMVYAVASGALGSWIKRSGGFRRWERFVSGATYCGLGLLTLLSGNGRRA